MTNLSLLILMACLNTAGTAPPEANPTGPPSRPSTPVIEGALADAFRLIEQEQTGPARIRLRKWMELNGEDSRALFLFGLSYHRERRYAASTQWLEQAVDATPNYPPAAHFLGWSNYYLGNTDAAEQAFRLHLKMTPDEGDTFYGLGLLALDAGDLTAAEDRFEQAIELQRDRPDRIAGVSKSMVRLAEIDVLRGDRAAARTQLEAAVAVDPDRHELYL